MTTTEQTTTTPKRVTPPVIYGLATVPSIPTNHDEPEKYILPGRRVVSSREEARKAAETINGLIQANGGETALKTRRAA